jgi:hypothetical protein
MRLTFTIEELRILIGKKFLESLLELGYSWKSQRVCSAIATTLADFSLEGV